jgi:hypothetical protein
MKRVDRVLPCLLVVIALAACARTQVSSQQAYSGPQLARPDRIIVHDFAATPADIPVWSSHEGKEAQPATPRTAEEIALGRELGAQVAERLVAEIRDMGLPAVRAAGQPAPRVGDIVLVGYFQSIDEGSRAKRMVIGFGSGSAEMTTQVEGYLMTERGLHLLGSGTVDSRGGKTPGVAAPLAVTLATSNPIGLIVGGTAKVAGEVTGSSTIEGAAKRTAERIAAELRPRFQNHGWIS